MKKAMILTTLIAGILLGTICGGCGESDETKANIKAIAETQKAQAAAAARAEAEKRRKIKEAREFRKKEIEILMKSRPLSEQNPFAPADDQKPAEEKK